MSVQGEVTTDIYRQMMELQEKLRQSEAERIRLEEMFTVLVKTLREEENMRLKSLENRYHAFLEDCAKRSYRNEKILRSIERVESGANALHAKTERLKLLRSHYEAYLGRVIPKWRQPAILRYGANALQSTHEVEWSRPGQLIPEESMDPHFEHHFPPGAPSRSGTLYHSNSVFTSDYFSKRLSDGEKHINSHPSDKNKFDTNYWNRISREPDGKEGRFIHGHDKSSLGNVGFHHAEQKNILQSKTLHGHFEDEYANVGRPAVEGLESTFLRNLSLGDRPNLSRNLVHPEGSYTEGLELLSPKAGDTVGKSEYTLLKKGKGDTSPDLREEQWFSDRRNETLPSNAGIHDKSCSDNTPRMTREPVEIKKPEIIVGKHHPEASFRVDFTNGSNDEGPSNENVKQENTMNPVRDYVLSKNEKRVESKNVRPEDEVRQPNPQARWSLLKHRRTIDKLKETLSFEEAQEPKAEKKQSENVDNLPVGPSFEPSSRKESDETDASQSLSDGWRPEGEQVLVPQVSATPDKEGEPRKDAEQFEGDEKNINEFELAFQSEFQEVSRNDINDTNEEVYEDNEDSYPESYYEQPPKTDYSRDIVSNVILEEDESEVNMQGELPEESVHIQETLQENNGYEKADYHGGQGDNALDFNGYSIDGTAEMKENQDAYQNYQPSDETQGYQNGDIYQANYVDMQHQEEYNYNNQKANNYNTNNVLEYNMVGQYQGNGEAQQYYDSQQSEEHGNYTPEGMCQGETFDSSYDPVQNYEIVPEQYNEGDGAYQQEYNQGQDGNYYGQREYDAYYQGQEEQNIECQGNNGEQNVGYSEATAYENMQGEPNSYADGSNNLPLRQSNLSHLLESDSESFQMEHGSAAANEDSDFDFSMSQQQ